MLLNRVYRCIWTDSFGDTRISFTVDVQESAHCRDVIERLQRNQRGWPERKYRLQIWDLEEDEYKDYPPINSKYALFSED